MRYLTYLLLFVLSLTHFACAQSSDDKKIAALYAQYMPFTLDLSKALPIKKAMRFSTITNTQQRKKAFERFMLPLIQTANHNVLKQRMYLIQQLAGAHLQQPLTNKKLLAYCQEYKANCDKTSTEKSILTLLKHINIVPISLALAQSANETAWGTSRFATTANNYFGQWCFKQGCGLVPKKRGGDAVHEVKKFATPLASVESYVHNLNTSAAYAQLRQIRADLLANKKNIQGILLADGLIKYSARKEVYVRELKKMIKFNHFNRHDIY